MLCRRCQCLRIRGIARLDVTGVHSDVLEFGILLHHTFIPAPVFELRLDETMTYSNQNPRILSGMSINYYIKIQIVFWSGSDSSNSVNYYRSVYLNIADAFDSSMKYMKYTDEVLRLDLKYEELSEYKTEIEAE
eukprot:Mrub_09460.p1 GENE.Mrub_09460~~Mrub_09460.p1  ORF type:complete len:134 (-),score=8.09 Mrub_09460:50-451(-)